jgi:heme exporter protein A
LTPPPDAPLLVAEGLTRTFGHTRAVAGVDVTVSAGDLVAVFGPNGAGKTTLLRMLGGLVRPTAGRVRVRGRDLRSGDPTVRRPIGLLSHQSFLYDDLTPLENLTFTARVYGSANPGALAHEALVGVGLEDRAHDPVRALSRGMVQRVALARALLADPDLLLLDEPFTGLDAPASRRIREVLVQRRQAGRGAVVVSHQFAEVWDIASHMLVMMEGGVIMRESPPPDLSVFMAQYEGLLRE